MSTVLKGNEVAKALKEKMRVEVKDLREKNIIPKVGIIRMGDRPDDIAYEKGVIKSCGTVDIDSEVFQIPAESSMEELINLVKKLNNDDNIHGILIFRPLPDHIDTEIIENLIDPNKDIDCMNPINLEKVFEGEMDGFVPCTPKAVVEILKYYNIIPLEGANIAVVNRSMVVGKPLSMMLLEERSTVTICHSRTKELPKITSQSDIVVAATGRAKMFGPEYFSEDNIVIDVGINDDGNGGICGDVDYDNVADKVKAITPVPGGVGSVTTTILLNHVLISCKRMNNIK